MYWVAYPHRIIAELNIIFARLILLSLNTKGAKVGLSTQLPICFKDSYFSGPTDFCSALALKSL